MKNKHVKILVLFIILLLILNITLFALKLINETIFWIVIIASAVFAYRMLPRQHKINQN